MMRGYGYGYGPMMSGGSGIFLLFLFIAFAILVVATIVFVILWAVQSSKRHPGPGAHGQVPPPAASYPPTPAAPSTSAPGPAVPGGPGHDEAIAIAKRRLASGEISADEYNEIIKTLNS